ncbi:MAG: hypothetical protein ABW292_12885 [Vicinamibacterales bacterium]
MSVTGVAVSQRASGRPTFAILSSWLGDYDQTLRWLRKGCEERGSSLPFVEVEPTIAPLLHDPRCREVLREYGLVAAP